MKTKTKQMLIAAAVLVLVGGLCIGIGFFLGAGKHKDQWNFEVNGHQVGVISGESVNIQEEYADNIRELDFEIGQCDVIIRTGDQFAISGNVPKGLKSTVTKDGVWKVKTDSGSVGVYVGFLEENNYRVEITIPEDAVFREVSIQIGAGTLTAEQLTADELEISIGAGQGTLSDMTVGSLAAECGAGQLTMSGEIRNQAELECGMGEIMLTLNAKPEQYDYSLECGMGAIDVSGVWSAGGFAADKEIYNGTGKEIAVECGMGHVMVDFVE